ncbi:MAG TPA: class I SAM-dependent methyltransferase [Chitinophagaceae bacterium]|nr:class I SAM-dependent methyltransferase [Chitinophagaceae bacterium]
MPSLKPRITHQFPARNATERNNRFEEQYLALRKKENRLYSDEQVRQLPSIDPRHPHYQEWLARKHSSKKLIKHIRAMKRTLSILEVGCGNGWLAHKLATIPRTTVTGFDINLAELQQAKKVFSGAPNLRFDSANPFSFANSTAMYDVIVFAASLQYFPSLDAVITDALRHLQPGGDIHIIDTHFYSIAEVAAAKQRTIDHFTSMGFPALANHYFHHSLVTLSKFNYQVLYNPHSWWNKWFGPRNGSPFFWINIKRH